MSKRISSRTIQNCARPITAQKHEVNWRRNRKGRVTINCRVLNIHWQGEKEAWTRNGVR